MTSYLPHSSILGSPSHHEAFWEPRGGARVSLLCLQLFPALPLPDAQDSG